MKARIEPEPDERRALTYGQLSGKHPDYYSNLWERLSLLYEGGYAMQAKAGTFVPQMPGESPERYRRRLQHTAYINYFTQVVGYLAGAVFQAGINVTAAGDASDPSTVGDVPEEAFYQEFAANADLARKSFNQMMVASLIDALVYRRAVIAVDMPIAPLVETRYDEIRAGGGRAYIRRLPLGCLLDWKKDDQGNFVWCILHDVISDRDTPFDDRDTRIERFTLWQVNDGRAAFTTYQSKPLGKDEPINPEDVIPVSASDVTSFTEIPVLELELPSALWVGNKAGPLAEEHFRKRSDLAGSIARTLQEIPYVKKGPEVPAVHAGISEVQSNPNRGTDPVGQARDKGWVELGAEDSIGFASPSGIAHEIGHKQCLELRDEIFRTAHAMALSLANTSASVGRSGESKREDRQASEIVLGALGDLVRDFACHVYKVVSQARGETVVWVAHGADQFSNDDSAELVEEMPLVASAQLPSPTFKKEYFKKFAYGVLPKLSPETKATIAKEIDKGVDEDAMHFDHPGLLELDDERDEPDDE